jgi:hypothetical protein
MPEASCMATAAGVEIGVRRFGATGIERGAELCFVFATCAALRRACWSVAFSSRARSALSDRTQPRPLLECDLRSPRASRLGAIRISGPVPSRASSEDAAPRSIPPGAAL